jgi:hypothetical protein
MQNRGYKAIGLLLLAVLLTSCGAAGKVEQTQSDSTEKPHLHPPVVVRHSWRDAMSETQAD